MCFRLKLVVAGMMVLVPTAGFADSENQFSHDIWGRAYLTDQKASSSGREADTAGTSLGYRYYFTPVKVEAGVPVALNAFFQRASSVSIGTGIYRHTYSIDGSELFFSDRNTASINFTAASPSIPIEASAGFFSTSGSSTITGASTLALQTSMDSQGSGITFGFYATNTLFLSYSGSMRNSTYRFRNGGTNIVDTTNNSFSIDYLKLMESMGALYLSADYRSTSTKSSSGSDAGQSSELSGWLTYYPAIKSGIALGVERQSGDDSTYKATSFHLGLNQYFTDRFRVYCWFRSTIYSDPASRDSTYASVGTGYKF